jgi:protocatechuate 3,4-dioxygenase beta subunit
MIAGGGDTGMHRPRTNPLSRRDFIRTASGALVSFVLAACGRQSSPEATAAPGATGSLPSQPAPGAGGQTQLPPTPACADADDVTPEQTEGPFYTPDTPERTSLLESGLAGTPLILTGQVLTTSCQPAAGALLDFWHADAKGEYDNAGYRLRGHQFADAAGRFSLETIVPGLYPGRTRHIHVKVQAPNQPVLTTQLYFPDEPDNNRDGIFNPDLLMAVQQSGTGQSATFNFVVAAG